MYIETSGASGSDTPSKPFGECYLLHRVRLTDSVSSKNRAADTPDDMKKQFWENANMRTIRQDALYPINHTVTCRQSCIGKHAARICALSPCIEMANLHDRFVHHGG